jgi:hypothetical protein
MLSHVLGVGCESDDRKGFVGWTGTRMWLGVYRDQLSLRIMTMLFVLLVAMG